MSSFDDCFVSFVVWGRGYWLVESFIDNHGEYFIFFLGFFFGYDCGLVRVFHLVDCGDVLLV